MPSTSRSCWSRRRSVSSSCRGFVRARRDGRLGAEVSTWSAALALPLVPLLVLCVGWPDVVARALASDPKLGTRPPHSSVARAGCGGADRCRRVRERARVARRLRRRRGVVQRRCGRGSRRHRRARRPRRRRVRLGARAQRRDRRRRAVRSARRARDARPTRREPGRPPPGASRRRRAPLSRYRASTSSATASPTVSAPARRRRSPTPT